jgi:hypothetical protein
LLNIENTMRLALSGLVALSLSTAAVAAPVFMDSFESPVISTAYQTFSAGSMVGDWSVGGLSVDLVRSPVFSIPAADGNQYVDLVGFGPGAISRSLTTLVPNQEYQLSFQYRGNFLDPNPAFNQYLGLAVAGAGLPTTIGITFADAQQGWKSATLNFSATSPSTLLSFSALTSGTSFNGGLLIDNISVAAVPEVHEWAMMLAGLGLVGWAARRRQQPFATPA